MLQLLGAEYTEEVRLGLAEAAPQPEEAIHALPNGDASHGSDAERPTKRAKREAGAAPAHSSSEAGGSAIAVEQAAHDERQLQRVLRLHGLRSLRMLDGLPGALQCPRASSCFWAIQDQLLAQPHFCPPEACLV